MANTDSPAGADAGPLDETSLAQAGPYRVEAREVVVPRPGGNGQFTARLYVPLPGAGAVDEVRGVAATPIVAFGHGYLTPVERYDSTLQQLASWGLTVIAPRSGGGPFPDHGHFADDLGTALDWLASVPASKPDWPGLPIEGEARGVSGHSMGAGAAVLAAAADPRIRSLATLAAAETRPSAIDAAARLAVPALFVAASDDAITPVAAHQQPMYDAVSGAPAQLRTIEGGSHCGFLDEPILPGLICDRAAIADAEQLALSRSLLVAWFRSELAGDERTRATAWPEAGTDALRLESKGSRTSD
jgi:dienelactone hydrolase